MLLDPDATLEAVASSLQDLPFPWSGDPVEIVGWGFSNVVLRVGTDVLVRVPRTPEAKDRSKHTAEVLRRLPPCRWPSPRCSECFRPGRGCPSAPCFSGGCQALSWTTTSLARIVKRSPAT